MIWDDTYKFGFFIWVCIHIFYIIFLLQKLVNYLSNKYNHDKNKIMDKISTIFMIITCLSVFFGVNVFVIVSWILLLIYIIMDKLFIAF